MDNSLRAGVLATLILATFGCGEHQFVCPDGAAPHWAKGITTEGLPEKTEVACVKSDGRLHGPAITWMGGHLLSVGHYKDGTLEGMVFAWDENGRRMSMQDYEGGKPSGVSREWNANGILVSEIQIDEDGVRSVSRIWYPDGTPKLEASMLGETLDGPFVTWDRRGHETARGTYRSGVPNGEWVCWDEATMTPRSVVFTTDGEPAADSGSSSIRNPRELCGLSPAGQQRSFQTTSAGSY